MLLPMIFYLRQSLQLPEVLLLPEVVPVTTCEVLLLPEVVVPAIDPPLPLEAGRLVLKFRPAFAALKVFDQYLMYFYLRRLQATAVLYFIVAEFSFFAPLSNEMCLRSGFYVFLIGCNLECKLCHMSLISGRKQFLVKSSGRSSLGHFFYIFTQPPELNRNTSSSFFYIYKMSP